LNEEFRIKFRGVRGSYPMPGKTTLRFGGNTSCVEVNAAGHLIILDAGTGIISLGEELLAKHIASGDTIATREPIVATILLSHTHNDHTQGFPFFKPAYVPTSTIYMFGPSTFPKNLETILSDSMISPLFPVALKAMPALKEIRDVDETKAVILQNDSSKANLIDVYREDRELPSDAVKIRCSLSNAHPTKVLQYRIEWKGKSLVYSTDTEGYIGGDTQLVDFAQNTDVLIQDAQYDMEEYISSRQGWGHSTPDMAVENVKAANVKRLILFHHEPLHNDEKIEAMEAQARKKFPDTIAAYEGLEMRL